MLTGYHKGGAEFGEDCRENFEFSMKKQSERGAFALFWWEGGVQRTLDWKATARPMMWILASSSPTKTMGA